MVAMQKLVNMLQCYMQCLVRKNVFKNFYFSDQLASISFFIFYIHC